MRTQRGFTLVELMIVVAIMAILATIAYPSYVDYMIRARLVDARTGLVSLQADLERHYQDNRSYLTTGTFVSPCGRPEADRTFGQFVVSCADLKAGAYLLEATGRNLVAGFRLTVNEQGLRQTISVPPGWSTCISGWVVRRGSVCA